MSLAKVQVVTRGAAPVADEVWVNDIKLPAVQSYQINGRWNEARTITVTILAESIDVGPEVRDGAGGT